MLDEEKRKERLEQLRKRRGTRVEPAPSPVNRSGDASSRAQGGQGPDGAGGLRERLMARRGEGGQGPGIGRRAGMGAGGQPGAQGERREKIVQAIKARRQGGGALGGGMGAGGGENQGTRLQRLRAFLQNGGGAAGGDQPERRQRIMEAIKARRQSGGAGNGPVAKAGADPDRRARLQKVIQERRAANQFEPVPQEEEVSPPFRAKKLD